MILNVFKKETLSLCGKVCNIYVNVHNGKRCLCMRTNYGIQFKLIKLIKRQVHLNVD